MTIKVSAVENEIGRVKCYQSKVKEDKLILKFGGVQSLEESTYIPLEESKFYVHPIPNEDL